MRRLQSRHCLLFLLFHVACYRCFAVVVVEEAEIDAATGDLTCDHASSDNMNEALYDDHGNDDFDEDDADEFEYEEEDDEDEDENDVAGDYQGAVQCGIWVAPSTIQGAGLGMFAGRDFDEGHVLERDIAIPIIDLRSHHPDLTDFLWDSYTWDADVNQVRLGHDQVEVACPGFGSAANSFLPLVNVRVWLAELDDLGLHRSKDPGAGAFTPYANRKTTATRSIVAGEELYIDYGDHWFLHRLYLGPIPLYEDLDLATELFESYLVLKEWLMEEQNVNPLILSDIWDVFVRSTQFVDSRVIGGFHHNDPDELEILEERGLSLTELRIEQGTRSPEWLQEHGTCADHFEARPSTIIQAGRGAFARRLLPEGTVVAQLPLIHITDKKIFDMYHLNATNGPDQSLGVLGLQLLTNYCYGHSESSLALCPYGPLVNFINHNQTMANIKLQWSQPSKGNHNTELLNVSLDHLARDATAKLAFEIVALRHIEADEELFLDYGDDWERAWQNHLQQWRPVLHAEQYVSAQNLNQEAVILPTAVEMLKDPLLRRSNIDLWCYGAFNSRPEEWAYHHSQGSLDDWIYDMISLNTDEMTRCDILRVDLDKQGEPMYTAAMWDEMSNESLALLKDVPRQALVYRDRPYTSDVHMKNCFRHSIGIPDAMFPKAWRNLATS